MKRISVRGPFSVIGVMAGLLAGSVLLPDGCRISEDQSLRLRVLLPLVAPLLLLASARWFPARRRRFILPAVVGAAAALAFAIGMIYGELAATILSFPVLWPVFAGMALAQTLVGFWAFRAARPRKETEPARTARYATWAIAVGVAGIWPPAAWLAWHSPVDPTLARLAMLAGAVLVAMAAGLVASARWAALRFAELARPPRTAAVLPAHAPAPETAELIDFGLGLDQRQRPDPVSAPPYRGAQAALVWFGDAELSARAIRRDLATCVLALVLAVAGLVGGVVVHRRLPPPRAPAPADFHFPTSHC